MKFFLHSMGRHAIFLYFLCFCLGSYGAFAQTSVNVSGTVSDRDGPIYGATVQVKRGSVGTLSDQDGYYTVSVQATDTLVFSYLGYQSQEIPVGGLKLINVVLIEAVSELDAVVVNAGYYTVSEKERTGSITGISAAAIAEQPVGNVFEALQGRLTGVSIVSTGGIPGSRFAIQIRGRNSIAAGNAPLYVVDGVPYMAENMEADFSVSLNGGGNPLQALNPADIENIEVLKDADATAIYGSRGANGVVLITTKKGKAGKSQVSVSVASGAAKVTRFWDMLSTEQYLAMRQEAFAHTGTTPTNANAADLLLWDQNRYTDWQDRLLGETAEITEAQVALSGGNERTQYRLGTSFREQGSVFPGDFSNRKVSGNLSVQHASEDGRFTIQGSILYSRDVNKQPKNDPTYNALYTPPNAPEIYLEDGSLNFENSTFSNPYALMLQSYENTQYSFVGNFDLNYRLFQGVKLKLNGGYNRMDGAQISQTPLASLNPAVYSTAEASFGNRTFDSWILEPQLHYTKSWNNSRVEVLLGGSFQENQFQMQEFYASGYTDDALLENIAAAPSLMVSQFSETNYHYMAVFGRMNYNYKHRYIFNVTGRRDGSSRFGPGNQWGNFGAVGAAWVFSEEDWFTESILSYGKLRGSYGTAGNDRISDYGYLDSWTASYYNYNGQGGLYPSRLYNPKYGWEVNRKLEVALESGFWKDRLRVNVAYYRNRSSSQLVGEPLPTTTGFGRIQNNLDAVVENTGWELELHSTPVKGAFTWSNSLLLTIPKNKLISFPDLELSTYANSYVIGQPLDITKVYNYTGIDPETGYYTFEDVNGDGSITAAEDQQTLRRSGQKYYGSFQNTLHYKGWQVQAVVQFVKQTGYSYFYDLGAAPGYLRNQPTLVLDHWQAPGDSAGVQAYTTGGAGANAYNLLRNSSAAYTDASYVRLQTVSLSYEFPKRWLETVKMSGLRMYVQGQNLWTVTNYDGWNPETQSVGALPPLTSWMVGMQISF